MKLNLKIALVQIPFRILYIFQNNNESIILNVNESASHVLFVPYMKWREGEKLGDMNILMSYPVTNLLGVVRLSKMSHYVHTHS